MTNASPKPIDQEAAKKPFSLMGMEPATHFESYDSVPWYRKQWFALFPLCAVALLVIAPAGAVYSKPTKTMKEYSEARVSRYTPSARAFFVAQALFLIVIEVIVLWG